MEPKYRFDLNELGPIYLYANTPMYLFRRLKDSSALYDATSEFSPEELIEQYNQIASKQTKTGEEVVAAYALLVSLSYRDYNEISNLLDKANTNGLDWAAHIIQILKATGKNTDSMEIKPSITLDNLISTSSRSAADDSMDISPSSL